MFEEQIKTEYNRITNLVATEQSLNHSLLSELLSNEDFYYNFVVADSEYNNFQVLTSIASERIYPDDLFANDSALNSLLEFQNKYSYLDNEILTSIITLAVDLRFNYTIRPVTTMLSFIFSDSHTISLQEAALKIKYFSGNDVILQTATSVLDSLAENEKNILLTKSFFRKSLHSKLKYLVSNIDSYSLVNLTDDIFSFMDELNGNNLLVLSLIIFFDDIRMLGVVEKLDSLKNNYSAFNQDSLLEIIDELINEHSSDFEETNDDKSIEIQEFEPNSELIEGSSIESEIKTNNLIDEDKSDDSNPESDFLDDDIVNLQNELSINERISSIRSEIEKLPNSNTDGNSEGEESVLEYKNSLNNKLSEIQDTK